MIDPIYVCTVADETQSLANFIGAKYSLEFGPNKNPHFAEIDSKANGTGWGGISIFQFSQSNLNYEYQFSAESV